MNRRVSTLRSRLLLAGYLRTHLMGASVGIRLAQHLAEDRWTHGALRAFPAEFAEEIAFTRRWVQQLSGFPELWLPASLLTTGTVSVALKPLRTLRGATSRAVSLEVMRSLVLAKKAMWELGLSLYEDDDDFYPQLKELDNQALRQAETLRALHARAARTAFLPEPESNRR